MNYRTYFSKNNTLIRDQLVNTGQNPVSELYFGGASFSGSTSASGSGIYSRYIFSLSTSGISNYYTQKKVTRTQLSSHTINITNSSFFDKQVLGEPGVAGRTRSTSFDLVLSLIPTGETAFDEGIGYDFVYSVGELDIGATIRYGFSNWFSATTSTAWSQEGVYSSTTSANTAYLPLKIQHFDIGNENVGMDVTDIVETIMSGGTLTTLDNKTVGISTSNFKGFILSYSSSTENTSDEELFTVGFFTRHTNSFYEPYLESVWTQSLKDDRNLFYLDKTNKLYLYTSIGNIPTNLDSLPSLVQIKDNNDSILSSITSVTQVTTGVYSVDVEVPSSLYSDLITFTDTWSGLTMNGRTLKNATLEFTLKENVYYNVGSDIYPVQDFIFNVSGVMVNEKVPVGDIRKVIVSARPLYSNDIFIIDNIYYRIFVRQGTEEIDVIPSTEVFRTSTQNYFYFDSSWLLAQDYYLEITILSNGERLTKKSGAIRFTVVDDELQ